MGLCLKEQIYQMSGLASKVLCGYGFPVALWTCKAKSPITSKNSSPVSRTLVSS